jgi:hypothetical protein
MKKLSTALILAVCAWIAPRASAQTSAQYMTMAANNYGNAANYAQNAFNIAAPGGANWTAAGEAHDAFVAAQDDAETSAYYYGIGDANTGLYYAQLALENSSTGEGYLKVVLAANKGNPTVLGYLGQSLKAAQNGDIHVRDAED